MANVAQSHNHNKTFYAGLKNYQTALVNDYSDLSLQEVVEALKKYKVTNLQIASTTMWVYKIPLSSICNQLVSFTFTHGLNLEKLCLLTYSLKFCHQLREMMLRIIERERKMLQNRKYKAFGQDVARLNLQSLTTLHVTGIMTTEEVFSIVKGLKLRKDCSLWLDISDTASWKFICLQLMTTASPFSRTIFNVFPNAGGTVSTKKRKLVEFLKRL